MSYNCFWYLLDSKYLYVCVYKFVCSSLALNHCSTPPASEPSNHWELGHLQKGYYNFKKTKFVWGNLEQTLGSYTALQFLLAYRQPYDGLILFKENLQFRSDFRLSLMIVRSSWIPLKEIAFAMSYLHAVRSLHSTCSKRQLYVGEQHITGEIFFYQFPQAINLGCTKLMYYC